MFGVFQHMAALMMAAAGVYNGKEEANKEEEVKRVRCADCVHCPVKPKNYCKAAKHKTTPITVCNLCVHFKDKEDGEQG